MEYNEEKDEYTCHNNKKLQYVGEILEKVQRDTFPMLAYMSVKIVVAVHIKISVHEVKETEKCRYLKYL